MQRSRKDSRPIFPPALRLGRVAWLALGLILAVPAFGQPRHNDELPAPTALDAAEAAKRLAAFRHARLAGDFCLRFQLVHYPRRGDEVHYEGVAWGTWNEQGPLTRFRLHAVLPANAPAGQAEVDWEWLVQNGPAPRVWVLSPGATAARELPPSQWREPLFPGVVYTPFDLLMPFVFWADFTYDGPGRVLGRVVDIYTMQPPAGSDQAAAAGPVRVSFDREISALVRAEQLDAKGEVARLFDLSSFEKVQDQWLIKTTDLLDNARRDHDYFTVKAAALQQKIDATVFLPEHLAQPAPLPPDAAWSGL
jgi:hypothetical protein